MAQLSVDAAAPLVLARSVLAGALATLRAEAGQRAREAGSAATRSGLGALTDRQAAALLLVRWRAGEVDAEVEAAFATLKGAVEACAVQNGAPLRSPTLLARWLGAAEQASSRPEPAFAVASEAAAAAAARSQVVVELRRLHDEGLSINLAMTSLLDLALQTHPAGESCRRLLLAARDPQGRGGRGALQGLPSRKTLWRWWSAGNLTPRRSVALSRVAAAEDGWRSEARRLVESCSTWRAVDLHAELARRWQPSWGSKPVGYTAVSRWLAIRAA